MNNMNNQSVHPEPVEGCRSSFESLPSRASGRTVGRSACAERTVYPSTSSGRTVGRSAWPERTVYPSRASLRARGPTGPEAGRTVFPNCRERSRRKGSPRTDYKVIIETPHKILCFYPTDSLITGRISPPLCRIATLASRPVSEKANSMASCGSSA